MSKMAVSTTSEQGKGQLLSRRISDLALTIKGTRVELLLAKLYSELDNAGIKFKPEGYLSDEWGCPHGMPVIGIPFYLVNDTLCGLEQEMTGVEAETDAEVSMYLRHEAGHAFNYAYRLYRLPKWRELFGRFSLPYKDDYRPVPFSTKFVRHVPAWYAQKHPDDDFAETFAVWLDPASDWRETYRGTGAFDKLALVDELAPRYGKTPPVVTKAKYDAPVESLTMTLDSWYEMCRNAYRQRVKLPRSLDNDLRGLFPAKTGEPAENLLAMHRRTLIKDVNGWTGVDRHLTSGLVAELAGRVEALGLKTRGVKDTEELARVAVFVSALAMNYLRYGKFVPE